MKISAQSKLVTRAHEHTVPIAITKATYEKLAEASRRLHVPIATVIDRMIERQEQAEIDPP